MKYETAGDPITGLKWTRKTMEKIAEELKKLGIDVCPTTVGRLLKQMDFSLRVNHKKISSGSGVDRDEQFEYIKKLRRRFAKKGAVVISVDTKKKELVGNFKNSGTAWNRRPVLVKDHDFRSEALGMAIPYGVYDPLENRGSVFVGVSHDTPQFAVSCIEKWWRYDGRHRYPNASEMLILSDNGGSNGSSCRTWKHWIHKKLCDIHGLDVTVCHYPPGASKWNPIEHQLFSEISKNWAGHPLDSYETIVKYIKTTKTSTGLKVKAYLDKNIYVKGMKISKEQIDQLRIKKHAILPKWNYTIRPS
jgi:hypothetical protein